MPTPVDQELYDVVKKYVMMHYKKSSAYASGAIVKNYKLMFKELYGDKEPYYDDKKPKKLKQWYSEKWIDVGNKDYPVYRPTRRVNASTPLLASEIDPTNLKQQINLKQKIKGNKNLPAFKMKNEDI